VVSNRSECRAPVTLFRVGEELERLRRYRDLGVARVVISLPAAKRDAIVAILDRWAPLMRATAAGAARFDRSTLRCARPVVIYFTD
jgi:hypothetical protein